MFIQIWQVSWHFCHVNAKQSNCKTVVLRKPYFYLKLLSNISFLMQFLKLGQLMHNFLSLFHFICFTSVWFYVVYCNKLKKNNLTVIALLSTSSLKCFYLAYFVEQCNKYTYISRCIQIFFSSEHFIKLLVKA